MKLLSSQDIYSIDTCKPKWNNVVKNVEITNEELYEQYDVYTTMATKYSKKDVNRIIDLIKKLEKLPKKCLIRYAKNLNLMM